MQAILPLLALLGAANAAEKVWQGFNSGNTLADKARTPKQEADFRAEFEAMQKLPDAPGHFNAVRLYTNIQGSPKYAHEPISAFQAAIDTKTYLLLGLWCSGTNNITNELDALMEALDKHGEELADLVIGISVGSEDLYRTSEKGIEQKAGVGTGPKEIVGFIKDTRKRIKGTLLEDKMLGHVDTWLSWANESNSAVTDEVDFIGADIYPFFEKDKSVRTFIPGNLPNSIDNAVALFDGLHDITVKNSQGKPVWITETGWPYRNKGENWGQSKASVANEQEYWKNIGCNELFGKVNTFWYTFVEGNPDSKQTFSIMKNDIADGPRFNLSCSAVTTSGAHKHHHHIYSRLVLSIATVVALVFFL